MRVTSSWNMTCFEMKGEAKETSGEVAFSISVRALANASAPKDKKTLAEVAMEDMLM